MHSTHSPPPSNEIESSRPRSLSALEINFRKKWKKKKQIERNAESEWNTRERNNIADAIVFPTKYYKSLIRGIVARLQYCSPFAVAAAAVVLHSTRKLRQRNEN